MQAVQVEGLTKRFGQTVALAGIDLEVRPGELFTLLGPSGCGKTTLLRLLAGLEAPDAGAIRFDGRRVEGLPAHRRNVGMVFQNYALFPHLTVAENVAYGLKARRLPAQEIAARVAEALKLVRMEDYGARRPEQLSGGQQQRVALARAAATRPALLLMDEPLSNLDARLRVTMREEIRHLQREVGITTVYVTHDQEEALAISDRIGVMEHGRLLQVGTPVEIYQHPAHQRVAAFVGTCAFLQGRVQGGALVVGGSNIPLPRPLGTGAELVVGLRPEMLAVLPEGAAPTGAAVLRGRVKEETFLGPYVRLAVVLPDGEEVALRSSLPPGTHRPGEEITVTFRPETAFLFDKTTGEAVP